MAAKFPGQNFLSGIDTKSRIFLLFAFVVGVALLVYLGVHFFGGGAATGEGAKVTNAPGGLVTVPGSTTATAQFNQAIEKASTQRAEMAKMNASQAASAVPTLTNMSTDSNCTVLCPGPDNANVADDVNALVNAGTLSQDDANALLNLAAKNVSVDEYAAALDALVKAGKLTPEQARKLLEKYKQQHANALLKESAQVMDSMIKSGQLPLSVANELLELQKEHLTPAEYAAELDRLVREGKLSPEAAAALLAQYTKQYEKEVLAECTAALTRMTTSGEITPDTAKQLQDLLSKQMPLNDYKDQLNKLVNSEKLTPAAARKLADHYLACRTAAAAGGILSGLLAKGGAAADEAKKLLDLQANNAPLDAYAAELKRAVAAGVITADEADRLYRIYQAMLAQAPATGVVPTVQGTVPGFAELQKRVQQAQPAAATTTKFTAPPPPAPEENLAQAQAELEAQRQQRIQAIIGLMSGQAQKLISDAWYVPKMTHREGSYSPPKETTTIVTGEHHGGAGSSSGSLGGGAGIKIPLIKTGTILFAVLDTAVDSDYPDTPVMATIIEGKFKGARLLGKLALAEGQDKVSLNFTIMDEENWISSKTINAYAIDPDTARTVMASEVDHHYLERYGAIMAASFVQGYSSAITNAGTSTTGIFGTSTTHPALSSNSKLWVGLGQIGTNLQSQTQKQINMPTTVKVNAGVGLGILFTAEVAE